MIVKGWNNGSPNNKTGGGYGIKIADKKDRKSYFQKEWTSVTIELEGEGEVKVSVSPSFWKKCRQLRKKEIGRWIINKINNRFTKWPKGHPPEFELVPISNRRFRLHSLRPSRKD